MEKAFRVLPAQFRNLLGYISPAAFQVVEWQGVLKKLAPLSKELFLKRQVAGVCDEFVSHLPQGMEFGKLKAVGKTKNEPERVGELVLETYFRQIFYSRRIFLDLRAERFALSDAERLVWEPNGLWVDMNPDFLAGLQGLYCGFYENDDEKMDAALVALKLSPAHLNEIKKTKLKGLILKHFGAGRNAPIRFAMADFVASFDSLFHFLKDNQVKISEDFLFLGVYLVTLYLHLDSVGSEFKVDEIFARALDRV